MLIVKGNQFLSYVHARDKKTWSYTLAYWVLYLEFCKINWIFEFDCDVSKLRDFTLECV